MGHRLALWLVLSAAVATITSGAAAQTPPAQPGPPAVAPTDLSGHWVITTTVTNGDTADQALIGDTIDLFCAQTAAAITCRNDRAKIALTGQVDGGAVQMGGPWRPGVAHITLSGRLVNVSTMQGEFTADTPGGWWDRLWGRHRAPGAWVATKMVN